MGKIFINDNQLQEWVRAAEGIAEDFGIEKALGYLIGEKFYNLVSLLHGAQKTVREIDEKKKRPDYNPVRVIKYNDKEIIANLDEMYESDKERIREAEKLLSEFAGLIKETFESHDIRKYLQSRPRFGALGHISTEEEHAFLVSHGAIEHSIDTEIEDALR
jgi:hypothetical protein